MSFWVQLTSGQGPAECQWVVAKVAELIQRDAMGQGMECRVLEILPGDEEGTVKSALLALEGADAESFAAGWQGTVQWIGKSPYRPDHKRKNWFVGVEVFAPVDRPRWSANEVRIDVMRSSGVGGQHVNKTSSAVRATHVPSGIVAIAREERSQHQNRNLALARLARLLEARHAGAESHARRQHWEQHASLERGNPVRVYRGRHFVLVKTSGTARATDR